MLQAPDERPTVLVVEDEALLALAVEDILADAGYHVIWRTDGPSALKVTETGPFPVAALVNLNLGQGMDGREVIRRLRQRSPDLPVVVATGYTPQSPQADLRGLGGPIARLIKPFEFDELLNHLVWALRPADGMPITNRRAPPTTRTY